MSGRARRMTAREIEKLLRKHGFVLVAQRGSHRKWRHRQKGLQVIVPLHRGRQIPIGTTAHILKAADIPREEWT